MERGNKKEEDIFEVLGLEFVPPDLRAITAMPKISTEEEFMK
jgi:DNA polymerase/3'-5' exonuclease PolX